MDIILLRHGETSHNFHKILNEDTTPLSDVGIMQIEKAATKINKMVIDSMWVSPHTRTMECAEIIKKYHDFPMTIKNDLREIDGGKLKGLGYNEASEVYPKEMDLYFKDHINNPLPGGESIMEAYLRAGNILREARTNGGNILMVTHAGLISLILANVVKDVNAYQYFYLDNASFSLIRIKGETKIIYVNRV